MARLCSLLIAASAAQIGHAQATDPLGEQEQRRRAQEQAIERERRLRAPSVQLQPAVHPEVDNGKVRIESPCFVVDEVTLEVPAGLSPGVEAAG
jgi:hemolysin activation/secretion protein